MNIKKLIDLAPRKRYTRGASEEQIVSAEKKLGLHFAPEYRYVLVNYGALSLKGEEFYGLDVVDTTLKSRDAYSDFPQQTYVISNTYIDGILLVQNSQGMIYTYQPNHGVQKVATSLSEYIQSL